MDVTIEQIREVLAEHARLAVDVATLAADDDLYQAGMSSHAAVSVMIGLEDAFDVEFTQQLLLKATFASMAAIQGVVELLRDEAGMRAGSVRSW